ncbi:hypothetical protein ACWEV4_28925 [Streptomyces sp. NPDC003860]
MPDPLAPPDDPNGTAMLTQLWVGTYHGTHDGDRVVVTTTRDDTRPLAPYGLNCTCGLTERHTDPVTLDRSAWRHTHPTLRDRMRRRLLSYLPARPTRA